MVAVPHSAVVKRLPGFFSGLFHLLQQELSGLFPRMALLVAIHCAWGGKISVSGCQYREVAVQTREPYTYREEGCSVRHE